MTTPKSARLDDKARTLAQELLTLTLSMENELRERRSLSVGAVIEGLAFFLTLIALTYYPSALLLYVILLVIGAYSFSIGRKLYLLRTRVDKQGVKLVHSVRKASELREHGSISSDCRAFLDERLRRAEAALLKAGVGNSIPS